MARVLSAKTDEFVGKTGQAEPEPRESGGEKGRENGTESTRCLFLILEGPR